MKRALLLGIGIAIFFVLPHATRAVETGWQIERFQSQIIVAADSSVSITERLRIDFASLEKHGIFRTIPVVYRDRFGNRLDIRIQVISVADETGEKWPYRTSRKGDYLEIKIGDPDRTVSGEQLYTVSYRVQRVITRFTDHDELYWNVTGTDWPVPIQAVEASVTLPQEARDATCFTGPYGSNLARCSVAIAGRSVTVTSDSVLNPGEGLTLVTAIPKGAVAMPSIATRIRWLVSDNWPYGIPLLVLTLLLWLYWQHGRDLRYKSLFDPSRGVERLPVFGGELVPSVYAPPEDLRPAEAGTLIDEDVNIRDIAATIVDLAVRGYLRIEEVEKKGLFQSPDYRLVRMRRDVEGLDEYETQLLTALFGQTKSSDSVLFSELKYKFATHLGNIRDRLYQQMTAKKLFVRRPDKVVNTYRTIGLVIAFFGMPAFTLSMAWGIAFLISGLLIVIFAKAMPKRTAHGRQQYLRILGLRNTIALGAYRHQLWEKANLFEEVLPFAIALNLTHKLAEAFAAVNVPPPTWYTGSRPFQLNNFTYALEDFTRQATTSLPARKSAASGGSGFSGGFSGGGFGGGGGGSW